MTSFIETDYRRGEGKGILGPRLEEDFGRRMEDRRVGKHTHDLKKRIIIE